MMLMMRWSRLNIYNANLESAKHMTLAGRIHYDAMVCTVDYCMTSPERRLVLKLHSNWDEISKDYKFKVTVKMDSY